MNYKSINKYLWASIMCKSCWDLGQIKSHGRKVSSPLKSWWSSSFKVMFCDLVKDLDYKESWVPKNRCLWTVVVEKTLQSPLDCREIKLVNPKGNQSWIFIGRTDAEAETPILWPPAAKNWLTGKDPDAGENWRQEEKGLTEDGVVGWHHWLNRHEFE